MPPGLRMGGEVDVVGAGPGGEYRPGFVPEPIPTRRTVSRTSGLCLRYVPIRPTQFIRPFNRIHANAVTRREFLLHRRHAVAGVGKLLSCLGSSLHLSPRQRTPTSPDPLHLTLSAISTPFNFCSWIRLVHIRQFIVANLCHHSSNHPPFLLFRLTRSKF